MVFDISSYVLLLLGNHFQRTVQGSGAVSIQAVFQSSVRGKWKKTFKTCIFCPFPVLIIDIVIDLIKTIDPGYYYPTFFHLL